ncbi:MAG: hypothetical protein NT062_10260 [Proteobacteria bacterium]|nr:hypothetical protein [Pseudomonadota bacterium]
MFIKARLLASVLALSVAGGALVACNDRSGTERWVTTENTNVKIDWDKVNEAYKAAEGPDDLEKRINEIYEGDEVISIAVQDVDAKQQVVTGFFDKNTSGAVDEGEKIFTMKRDVTGAGAAQVQTVGYGPYYGYTSPFMSIASGMLIGSMLSHAFSPSYVPMYGGGYTTSPGRVSALTADRSSYRATQPERFNKKTQSGRAYGSKSSAPSRTPSYRPSRSGGSFGARPRVGAITRLTA